MTTDLEKEREAIKQIIIDHLTAVYVCNRVWGAWYVGTMDRDDFEPAQETDLPDELTDALMARAALAARAAPQSQSRIDRLKAAIEVECNIAELSEYKAHSILAYIDEQPAAPQEQQSDEELNKQWAAVPHEIPSAEEVESAWARRDAYLSRYGAAPQGGEDAREIKEAAQRARLKEQFKNRRQTAATADFDLPAPNDPPQPAGRDAREAPDEP